MSLPYIADSWVEIRVKCPYCGIVFEYEGNFDPASDSTYYECSNCNCTMLIESPLPSRDIT